MTPTDKSPEIEKLLTNIAGISRQDAADAGICTWCKSPCLPSSFEDELSLREHLISGLCQKCQNSVFGSHRKDE